MFFPIRFIRVFHCILLSPVVMFCFSGSDVLFFSLQIVTYISQGLLVFVRWEHSLNGQTLQKKLFFKMKMCVWDNFVTTRELFSSDTNEE